LKLKTKLPIGKIGFSHTDHVDGGLVQPDESSVVNLTKTEELKDLAPLGSNPVDTTDADDEGELALRGDIEVSLLLSKAIHADFIPFPDAVFPGVFLGALVDLLAGLPDLLPIHGDFGKLGSTLFSKGFPLLKNGLGDHLLCSGRRH